MKYEKIFSISKNIFKDKKYICQTTKIVDMNVKYFFITKALQISVQTSQHAAPG